MAILFHCDCGQRLKAPDDMAGRKAKCFQCGAAGCLMVQDRQGCTGSSRTSCRWWLIGTLADVLGRTRPLYVGSHTLASPHV